MSNRSYRTPETQGTTHVFHGVTMIGAGTGAPTNGEGDPNGAYFTFARSATGTYTIVTKDAFLASVSFIANVVSATDTDYWTVTPKLPSQSTTTYAWTVEFVTYKNGTPADVATSDQVNILWVLRNSLVLP